MNNSVEKITWQKLPDAEQRLSELRQRDLEIASIALGLQLRTKLTSLEQEVLILRSIEKSWSQSRISKLYFSIPRILRALLRRIKGKP